MIKQADRLQVVTKALGHGSVDAIQEAKGLSPYLCPWCRNGRSLNEAHEKCLAEGRFTRFWPVKDVTLAEVPVVPVREIALGELSPAERHILAWFYLYVVVKAVKDTGAQT